MSFVATNDRLRLLLLRFSRLGMIVTFDKRQKRARITWIALVFPVRQLAVSFTDIAGIELRKRERAPNPARYSVALRRKSAADLYLTCGSRQRAMTLLKQIRGFLEIQ